MKKDIVYVVMNDAEVKYASINKEYAKEFAHDQSYNARQEILEEWGIDNPTYKDIAEADFQAGFDGYYYEVVKVNISNKTEGDIVELPDGTEIYVSEILEKLI